MPPRKRTRVESPEPEDDTSASAPASSQILENGALESEAGRKERLRKFNEQWKVGIRTDQEVLGTPCCSCLSVAHPHYHTAAQMETWTSVSYGHFNMPPEIVYEDGLVKYRFWCLK